ncbi:hypothetical protein [Sphingobacterium rhinopitheci]|uniref:hypothetical protein n=1 Tax=Sphingobacterium rhinopitheci TaxID=2781960 RepID=UPI001F517FB3|nr:hypothetical protein [Sphingobacterium rhinopitheci]MCI0920778.1 hypothetical protein [Sphingobacterium rhinopitheci]
MKNNDFQATLSNHAPPAGISIPLEALWWEAKGNWEKAHQLVDHLEDYDSAHIHGYLHRVEGDLWNAQYWYNRAKQVVFKGTLKEEWHYLVDKYL